MSFSKPWCFALLFTVMLAPACAKKSASPEAASSEAASSNTPAVTCDGGIVFQGQCTHKGDIVKFGQYPQASEAPEPLEWIVLYIDSPESKMLLLSKYVIDARVFDPGHEIYSSWAECDMRKWLHDTSDSGFLRSTYFTAQEQSRLVEVTNKTTSAMIYLADYAQNEEQRQQFISEILSNREETKDKVFLLDILDIDNKAYFANAKTRQAKATTHAIQNGLAVQILGDPSTENCANVQCGATWWLRSVGMIEPKTNAVNIERSGATMIDGMSVDGSWGADGVRPSMWVRAD